MTPYRQLSALLLGGQGSGRKPTQIPLDDPSSFPEASGKTPRLRLLSPLLQQSRYPCDSLCSNSKTETTRRRKRPSWILRATFTWVGLCPSYRSVNYRSVNRRRAITLGHLTNEQLYMTLHLTLIFRDPPTMQALTLGVGYWQAWAEIWSIPTI